MKVSEFEEAFIKGLGRAWLYVESLGGDDSSIKKILERGCVEDFSYDRQCEGDRSYWVYEMLMMSNDPQYYERHIIERLSHKVIDDSWEISHAIALLACFAKGGSESAKLTIAECFTRNQSNAFLAVGAPIIEISGINGFLSLAKQIGEKLGLDEDGSDDEQLLMHAINLYGEQGVLSEFRQAARSCSDVRRYYDEVFPQYRECIERRTSKKRKKLTRKEKRERLNRSLEEVLDEVERSEKEYPGYFMSFGRIAYDQEIDVIIDRIEIENRVEQLIRYIWIFRRRYNHLINPMPERLLTRLLELLMHDNDELISAVSYSLSTVSDDRVRAIAKKSFMSDPQKYFLILYKLLKDSAEQEDTEELAVCFASLPRDIDEHDVHSLVMDITHMVGNLEIDLHLQQILKLSYDWTPCGICRYTIYQLLESSSMISKEMAEEYKHDAYRHE